MKESPRRPPLRARVPAAPGRVLPPGGPPRGEAPAASPVGRWAHRASDRPPGRLPPALPAGPPGRPGRDRDLGRHPLQRDRNNPSVPPARNRRGGHTAGPRDALRRPGDPPRHDGSRGAGGGRAGDRLGDPRGAVGPGRGPRDARDDLARHEGSRLPAADGARPDRPDGDDLVPLLRGVRRRPEGAGARMRGEGDGPPDALPHLPDRRPREAPDGARRGSWRGTRSTRTSSRPFRWPRRPSW